MRVDETGCIADKVEYCRQYGVEIDASLTLPEFTQIIIVGVHHNNNFHTLSKYDRTSGCRAIYQPHWSCQWNCGLTNLTGWLRTAPE